MMGKKYEMVGDGWETIGPAVDLQCCDCKLVHTLQFRAKTINGKPQLQWKVDRNERATAALRRKRKRAK